MIASESRQPTRIRLRDKSSPQRQLSALVAVLLGRAMFGEPNLCRRLASALFACAGAACLLFAR
jgi:hypothetical protein